MKTKDPNQIAKSIVDKATGAIPIDNPREKDPAAVSLGSKGGKARALKLSDEDKSAIAKKASDVRWKK